MWAWILLIAAILLVIGWNYDRKRKSTRGLERPASTGHTPGRTGQDARRDADAGGHSYGGGGNSGPE
jgi:hypothetical protein